MNIIPPIPVPLFPFSNTWPKETAPPWSQVSPGDGLTHMPNMGCLPSGADWTAVLRARSRGHPFSLSVHPVPVTCADISSRRTQLQSQTLRSGSLVTEPTLGRHPLVFVK